LPADERRARVVFSPVGSAAILRRLTWCHAPRRVKFFVARAEVLISCKNYQLAYEELSLAIRYGGVNKSILEKRAKVLSRLGRSAEAEADLVIAQRQAVGGVISEGLREEWDSIKRDCGEGFLFILPIVEELQGVFSLESTSVQTLIDKWGNELFEYKVASVSSHLCQSLHSAQKLRVQPVAHLEDTRSIMSKSFVFARPLSGDSAAVLHLARQLAMIVKGSSTPVFVHHAGLLHSAAEWCDLLAIYDHSVALFNLLCSVEVTTAWPLGVRSQGMAALGLPDVVVLSNSDEEYVVQAVVRAAVDSIKKARGHYLGEGIVLPINPRTDGNMECRHSVCEGIEARSSHYNPFGWTIIGTPSQLQRYEGGDESHIRFIGNLRSRSIAQRKAAVQSLREPMFALESVREAFRRVLRDSHVPIRLLALVVIDSFSPEVLRIYVEELLWLRKAGEDLVASTAFDLMEKLRPARQKGIYSDAEQTQ
jgi:hypothetical protein